MVTPLRAQTLRTRVEPELFGFETTAEVPLVDRPVGQARALRALEFGLGMESPGYNVFVVGLPGAGRRSATEALVGEAAARREPPQDLVYLYNFDDPERPVAACLPAGTGELLRAGMEAFVRALRAQEPGPAGPRLKGLRETFRDEPKVLRYLTAVERDLAARGEGSSDERWALACRVNLLVNHAGASSAPVVFEPNPTRANLLGTVEQRLRHGSLGTDFTLLRAGALHRANGGYLMMDSRELLQNPSAYDALKRVLKEGAIRMEESEESDRVVSAASLRPEPFPARVKVILLGTPWIYDVLQQQDDDFPKLFKVKSELSEDVAFGEEARLEYAQLAARVCATEGLLPLHRDAVAKLVEEGLRRAEHQHRVATHATEIADLVREAHLWAKRNGAEVVRGHHVATAVKEKVCRNNDFEEYLGRLIADGTILIDTAGSAVGQANGLSIFDLGDYAFGKPCRVTAKVFLGKEGVINLEREADMGGRIHNKGVLILQGFFGSRYARRFPISFAATLCFEQSYGGVEGDSASSAELFALVSALAEVPIRQDIAVTGSVNQMGQIQSVGGINLKIEGFYKTCRMKGLTGTQGVIIPASNVQNLMLADDVVEAVEHGTFHIYPIATVDEGLAILTGLPAGQENGYGEYPEGTVNGKVMRKVERLTRQWKKLHQED